MNKGELLLRAFEDACKQWGEDEKLGEDARTSGRLLGRFRKIRREFLDYVKGLEDLTEMLEGANDAMRSNNTDLARRLDAAQAELGLMKQLQSGHMNAQVPMSVTSSNDNPR